MISNDNFLYSSVRIKSKKAQNVRQYRKRMPDFLACLEKLKESGIESLAAWEKTLDLWKEEMVRMFRFPQEAMLS